MQAFSICLRSCLIVLPKLTNNVRKPLLVVLACIQTNVFVRHRMYMFVINQTIVSIHASGWWATVFMQHRVCHFREKNVRVSFISPNPIPDPWPYGEIPQTNISGAVDLTSQMFIPGRYYSRWRWGPTCMDVDISDGCSYCRWICCK